MSTREPARAQYLCRRCKSAYLAEHVPDANSAAWAMAVRGVISDDWEGRELITPQDCHRCPDGAIGISDLVGFIPDELLERGILAAQLSPVPPGAPPA